MNHARLFGAFWLQSEACSAAMRMKPPNIDAQRAVQTTGEYILLSV